MVENSDMEKPKLSIRIDTKETTEELRQLIKLLKEVDKLIDSITSKEIKILTAVQHTHQ